jgi:hypothetical protein
MTDKERYRILVGRLLGKCPHVRPRRDGWIILRYILVREVMCMVGGRMCLRIMSNGRL